jgi:hypothetical protein
MMRTALCILILAGVAFAANEKAKTPDEATCGPAGVNVTVSLKYNADAAGGMVAGAGAVLSLAPPLSFPDGAAAEVKGRVTNLKPSEQSVAPPKRDADGHLRVVVSTAEPGIPPRVVFKIRLDCPAGKTVRASDIGCTTAEVADGSGLPMPVEMAKAVTCAATRVEAAK